MAVILYLNSLRRKSGDDEFFKVIGDFFAANTTKTVSAQAYLDAAHATYVEPEAGTGAVYVASDIDRRLASAVLVYGTMRDAGANRYAAETLQRDYLNQYESQIPIYKDFEATEEVLQHHDVIFVGWPEANSALEGWASKLKLNYSQASSGSGTTFMPRSVRRWWRPA